MSILKNLVLKKKETEVQKKAEPRLRLVDEEALAFQPDTVEVELQKLPPIARWVLYSILGLMLFGILWATFSKVDRIVSTTGKLVEVGHRIVVQPMTQSTIQSINVKTGDIVKKGQILATLDPTIQVADAKQVEDELKSVEDEIKRLDAQINGKKLPDLMGTQQDVLTQKQVEHESQVTVLKQQLAGLKSKQESNRRNQAMLGERYSVVSEMTTMRKKLFDSGHGSKLQYLEKLEEKQRIQLELENVKNQAEEIAHELQSKEAELQTYVAGWSGKASEQLVEAQRRRDKLQQDLAKAEYMGKLVNLRAVEDAIVLDVVQKSMGSVLQPAETVATLVPLDAPLEAEVSIPARDIGWTKLGDKVRVKLDAFPFQQHGTIDGVLKVISPDAFTEQKPAPMETEIKEGSKPQAQAVYRAKVELTQNHLRRIPKGFRLVPGMAVAAEIKVGTRSVISYFFDPILKALDESIREPR